MSTHSVHPSTLTTGLVDGCPRCEEHAAHPLRTLDREHIVQLADRVKRGEVGRSSTEQRAMDQVADALYTAAYCRELGIA